MLTIGSLFSGIGGLELGLERVLGARTLYQVEREPFAQQVLAARWPRVQRFDDVRTLTEPPPVDILCGGFPCQDVSDAGTESGLKGRRSGLWFEFHRIAALSRPTFLAIENVGALRRRGLDTVIQGLRQLGYESAWSLIRASDVGAPHRRERLFIVAWRPERVARAPKHVAFVLQPGSRRGLWPTPTETDSSSSARMTCARTCEWRSKPGTTLTDAARLADAGLPLNAVAPHLSGAGALNADWVDALMGFPIGWTDPSVERPVQAPGWPALPGQAQHAWEPARLTRGKVHRGRLRALGNAVVPQCAEIVGLALGGMAR